MKKLLIRIAILLLSISMVAAFSIGCKTTTATTTAAETTVAATAAETTVAATAAETTNEKKLVLGNVVVTLENAYHQADTKHFEEDAAKINAETVIIDGKLDTPTIVDGLDQLIAKKVDAIVIQCVFGESINEGIKSANAAGIPVLPFFNKPTEVITPFLAINEAVTSRKMGQIAAKKWKELYPDIPIKVGIITYAGVPSLINGRAIPFWEGVQSVDPEAELVSELDGAGSREKSLGVAQDMLQAHPEINIFYAVVSDSALGALTAFESIGRGKAENGVPLTEIIVGTDAPLSELVKVYDPNSSFKITQGLTPKDNAQLKVDTLIRMINGEIGMNEDITIAAHDFEIDYWNSNIEEIQKWMNEQYLTDVNIADEIEKANQ